MVPVLKGLRENVKYKNNRAYCLYDNKEKEGYPTHWHIPMEIIMPYREDYTVKVCNQTYILDTHSILFVSPGVLHSINEPVGGARLILQIDFSALQSIQSVTGVLNLMSPCFFVSRSEDQELYDKVSELLQKIKVEYNKESDFSELSIYSCLFSLLSVIASRFKSREPVNEIDKGFSKNYSTKFIDVCNYINENCTKDLTLDTISSYAGFSKYHFSRLFKDFTGVTFYKYLNQKRISYAQTLLLNPDNSITDIAYDSGFESISAFIRMFKILNDCTPSEYRNMYIHLEKTVL